MQLIRKFVSTNEFTRNVLTLMTGTAISQAIPIAISPILTRLYTPEDFGVLALYVAIVSIVAVIATMRYEFAIVQPQQDEDAASIVVLSAIITTFVSIVFFLLVFFFNESIRNLLDNDKIGPWLYLLPVSVWMMGIYQSLNYWHTRRKQFKQITISRVSQSSGGAATQMGIGVVNASSGLIIGQVVGQFMALIGLLKGVTKSDKLFFQKVTKAIAIKNAKKYKKLPQLSVFGAIADRASLQMPIFVLGKYFDLAITGMFSLTFRVLNVPMSLVSTALSQVLFQKISNLHHKDPNGIHKIIIKLFCFLVALMIPFIAFIWIFGQDLFAFVFGEPWREAGTMASILVFAVAIRFAVSPLSTVLALEHNIKMGVLWQVIYFFTISLTLIYFSNHELEVFLIAFVLHEVILYLFYFALILKGAKYIKETVE